MRRFVYLFAVLMAVVGVWDHDWRLIVASVAVAAIWPLISAEVSDTSRGRDPEDVQATTRADGS